MLSALIRSTCAFLVNQYKKVFFFCVRAFCGVASFHHHQYCIRQHDDELAFRQLWQQGRLGEACAADSRSESELLGCE